ncbi:MAG: preprotein translocase subunit SecG [Chitinophagaceae bacterium]|nr:MAG: preprotein translocase subunit SecG [Chitinophagaceae bacterium]
MTTIFIILVIIASVVLSFIVLIQNPKGGGLAGSFSGVSSQFMGVKQTNDVMERGTWIFAGVIALLCLLSTFFLGGNTSAGNDRLDNLGNGPAQKAAPIAPKAATTPAGTTTLPAAPAAGDSAK